jgi:hypothetical protein
LVQVNGFDRSRIPSFREFCEDKDQWRAGQQTNSP